MARTLDRDAIVDAAIALVERDGFGALSMRKVAVELGVGTMSLYWYVPTRDDLLDLMFDRAVAQQVLGTVPADWREALAGIAHGARRMFEQMPWVTELGLRSRLGSSILAHVEQSIEVAESLGLPLDEGMYAVSAIDDYVVGYVTGRHAHAHGIEPALNEEAAARVEAGEFPRYAALVGTGGPQREADQEFEVGLALLLDGIAVAVAAGRMPSA